jgi:thiosulfate/3-mercaptopyruvate sulfurtransferase
MIHAKHHTWSRWLLTCALGALPLTAPALGNDLGAAAATATTAAATLNWKTIITVDQLKARVNDPNLLIIDARRGDEYAEGHIPGAINIPGANWRSPQTKPAEGKGLGQYIWRNERGEVDVTRYEKLLSDHGIRREHQIVVYGNHGGKADGSTPASILLWLGHPSVQFLDGVGTDRWKEAGLTLSTEPRKLEPSAYKAQATTNHLWSLDTVLGNLKNDQVVFLDVRSEAEYTGANTNDNKRGGHIPGARNLNYLALLDRVNQTTLSPEKVKAKLAKLGVTPDKTVVLYCQTATRTSLAELVLRDLGYANVKVYDASWQEYGNRDDTPIETTRTN